jgi:hypothetical protein
LARQRPASHAEEKSVTLGNDIVTIAERMHLLADHIMRQETASGEISRSVCTISDKVKKLREEITSTLASLVKAEEASLGALRDGARCGQPALELAWLQGEVASWKRRAAATLVGLIPPSADNEACVGRGLAAWAARVTNEALLADPHFTRLKEEDEAAHVAIQKAIRHVQQKDYAAGTQAYVEAEKAIARLIESAQALARALSKPQA